MEQFQLSGLEKQYPTRLSGGQQQRTALARILASEPDILLLDEPFSAMDSYLKEELQLEMQRRIRNFAGCTILVSHDRDEIYRLCTDTMIMEKGKNVITDNTKALFENPRKVAAARLTGCKKYLTDRKKRTVSGLCKRLGDFSLDGRTCFGKKQRISECGPMISCRQQASEGRRSRRGKPSQRFPVLPWSSPRRPLNRRLF